MLSHTNKLSLFFAVFFTLMTFSVTFEDGKGGQFDEYGSETMQGVEVTVPELYALETITNTHSVSQE